jgi:hypothetical protein
VSLHDVRLEDLLYTENITPIAKVGPDILIHDDYNPLQESKDNMSVPNNSDWFRNDSGKPINTNELGKKLGDLSGSQAPPHKRTGTIDYHSTATTGVTGGLRSNSLLKANSSGISSALKFDSQGICLTPIAREISQKLNDNDI